MKNSELLDLPNKNRIDVWNHIIATIESYITTVHHSRVTPELDPDKIRNYLRSIDFNDPITSRDAIDFVVKGLWDHQVHTPHPRYFGLFNPCPTTMGIAADTLVATFNPQLAAWSHSPFANEIEQHLIRKIGQQFGYDRAEGMFTSGGTEANLTALLTALTYHFPEILKKGIRGLTTQPIFYSSFESHHSLIRAARTCGLGSDAIRLIPVNQSQQMDIVFLRNQIKKDKEANFSPFLVVATAGTTNAGIVDPIKKIADITKDENIWYHVDAAWGGAAVFVPEFRYILEGIERADSITFDAHKWLSVPMGAGIYLTPHSDILYRTFGMSTDYMPTEGIGLDVKDPYMHSFQWSRRFIGLKVFLSLLVAGWEGYQAVIKHQVEMGNFLRQKLEETGWRVVNKTNLPVVCFINEKQLQMNKTLFIKKLVGAVLSSGQAWISSTKLNKEPVLRVCITNYRTTKEDVLVLIDILDNARAKVKRENF